MGSFSLFYFLFLFDMEQDSGLISVHVPDPEPPIHKGGTVSFSAVIQNIDFFRIQASQLQMVFRVPCAGIAPFPHYSKEEFLPVGGNPAPGGKIRDPESFRKAVEGSLSYKIIIFVIILHPFPKERTLF